MKKKHTILIVPPHGVPLKAFRIRLWVAIVIIGISLAGFTGFFVPLKTITDNVAEQNQRKNLTEQNNVLLQKIISALRMLQNVRSQISQLEIKQKNVVSMSGSQQQENVIAVDTIDCSHLSAHELISHIQKIERQFGPFGRIDEDSGNVFDTIPVLSPLVEPFHISRRYGTAYDPFSGTERSHYGTDFIAEAGTPVRATASGIVQRIEKHTLWGNKVTIKHCGSYTTIYAHLGSVNVASGKHVERGEIIGEMGLSGLTSGPHVHYEIWRNDQQVDPEKYLFPIDLIAANK
jgi:murein DD-endopeptidase MepM/ murein hydrolase activator NlpD